MEQAQGIEHFIKSYSLLTKDNLESLSAVYHSDFLFEDPIQVCNGWYEYLTHLKSMYENTTDCRFIIKYWVYEGEQGYIQWTLIFSHSKLFNGLQREVEGCSRLEFQEGLVCYQRDFFDCGEMIYEGIPLLRKLIQLVKYRISSSGLDRKKGSV